jgi:hypothetical protein
MARGMTMVTLTDHDTIDGAAEIVHLGGHVFVSEEISCRFPENGCIAHVIALDITEQEHLEIHRLRNSIYEVVPYLRQQGIPHFLCHPLSPPNGRLSPELLEKQLLLFTHFEALNGTRDDGQNATIERLLAGLDRPRLERLAERHGLTPVEPDLPRGLVGGSDDHGAVGIARAYTEFEGPPRPSALREAFRERRTRPGGQSGTALSLAHSIYGVCFGYYRSRAAGQMALAPGGSIYENILKPTSSTPSPRAPLVAAVSPTDGPLGELAGALRRDLAPLLQGALATGLDDHLHQAVFQGGRRLVEQTAGALTSKLLEGAQSCRVEEAQGTQPPL